MNKVNFPHLAEKLTAKDTDQLAKIVAKAKPEVREELLHIYDFIMGSCLVEDGILEGEGVLTQEQYEEPTHE